MLKKEFSISRTMRRIRGQIILGNIIVSEISDEEKKQEILNELIEIDGVLKSKNASVKAKADARKRAIKIVLKLNHEIWRRDWEQGDNDD